MNRVIVLLVSALLGSAQAIAAPAFPGAQGWASETPGGRGGKIIRVTTLDADGPGSLKAAIDTKGPRIVVFEVAGQIDLGKTSLEINEPFLTIAGQTAPSPGITLIRGGIDVKSHDIIIRHIRVRT
jgi:pectate lyase